MAPVALFSQIKLNGLVRGSAARSGWRRTPPPRPRRSTNRFGFELHGVATFLKNGRELFRPTAERWNNLDPWELRRTNRDRCGPMTDAPLLPSVVQEHTTDLTLRFAGPLDATLRFEFRSAEGPESPVTVTIPLRDILGSPIEADLDDRGSRLLVRRAPGDLLRVAYEPRPLVFAPEEVFSITVQPHLTPISDGTQIEVETVVQNTQTGENAWVRSQKTVIDPTFLLSLDIPMPAEEGVYDVVVSLKQTPSLKLPPVPRVPLGFSKTLATRKVQLVVLGTARPGNGPQKEQASREVVGIDPANPGWWKRFATLPKIPGLPQLWQGPLGNGRCEQVDHALGRLSRLKASPRGDMSWEAYSLPIQNPGRPHILEIDYPAESEQILGVSVFEPDAAGSLMPVQLDSGIVRSREILEVAEARKPGRCVHRLPFWPRTKAPLVLVYNLSNKKPALFGKIGCWKGANACRKTRRFPRWRVDFSPPILHVPSFPNASVPPNP